MAHCAEARRVRRELDKELAAASAHSGRVLTWTAADLEILQLIASAIDRKADLQHDYDAAHDAKDRLKISSEMRLHESSIERLLRRIKTDIPPAESQRTIQARRAVMHRWHPDAAS
jgi:hypothetical protein